MEGQKRPSPMGFSSMYSRASKRFDRASLIDSFKQIKDRGVRYEDMFPGSYDPAARVQEIIEDETDAEVIFNGVQTVWNGIKLCPDRELEPGLLQGLQRLDRRVPGLCARAVHLQRHLADDGHRRLPRPSCTAASDLGLRTAQLESYPSGSFSDPTPEDDRFWAAAVELGYARSTSTRSSSSPPATWGRRSTPGAWPQQESGPRCAGIDVDAGSFPVIMWRMIATGRVRAVPGPEARGLRGAHRLGALLPRAVRRVGAAQPATSGTCPCCRASTSAATSASSTSSTRWARPTATTSAWPTSCGAPTSRTRRVPGRWTTSSGVEVLERAGATPQRDRADHVEERGGSVLDALRRSRRDPSAA